MKDYEMNIIDYRGGKALLIDSVDIMALKSRQDSRKAHDLIKESYEKVDYVLLITSMPFPSLRPSIRKLFERPSGEKVNCFRHITPKGKQTWAQYLDEMMQGLKQDLKEVENEMGDIVKKTKERGK